MTDLQPHQQRVVTERTELAEKYQKLSAFIGGETYLTLDTDEQERLHRQLLIMRNYLGVLNERIGAFS